MKKLVRPACLLFSILTLILFFFVGLLYAGWMEAGKNQGLAGGAIVLGYGVIFAIIALLISFFATYHLRHKSVVRGNIALTILILASFLLVKNNADARKKKREEQNKIESQNTTKPINQDKILALIHYAKEEKPLNNTEMGLGVFKPNIKEGQALYFYANPNFEKPVLEHFPTDSLLFDRTELGQFTVSQAPPWLVPLHLKMDYDILYFKVISLSQEFLKVEGNKNNGFSTYVSKGDGDLFFWPDFLLKVNSIEFLKPADKMVRIKPLIHASLVTIDFDFMKPMLITESWAKVALLDANYNKKGEGWIQWRKKRSITNFLFLTQLIEFWLASSYLSKTQPTSCPNA